MVTPLAVSGGWQPAGPDFLPLPQELSELPDSPRVLVLTDGDCLSHGLVDGTAYGRASNHEVRACLDRVHATAAHLDPRARARCAVSSETAVCHLDVMTAAQNNSFAIRRGLDGADGILLEELAHLIDARTVTTRPGHKGHARLADLVMLVGQEKAYAQPVRQLRLLGIPTWVLIPSRFVAASLYRAATAVTFIGPCRLA